VPLEAALQRMRQSPSASVKELATFIETCKRGFAHPRPG